MTTNEKIMASVGKALRWELDTVGDKPGNCLRDTRIILEDALGWLGGEFYRRHRTHVVETPSADSPLRWTRNPHARDMERSLREQGMAVGREEMQPGDLLFKWNSAPYQRKDWLEDFPGIPYPDETVYIGHCMIYAGMGLVLENINPGFRSYGLTRQNLSLTPLERYERYIGPITTVIRFNPSAKEQP